MRDFVDGLVCRDKYDDIGVYSHMTQNVLVGEKRG